MDNPAEVAKIAAGLRKGQAEVISAMSSQWQSPSQIGLPRQRVAGAALAHSALIEREWQDGCANCTYYRLTALGLAVRAHILQDKANA